MKKRKLRLDDIKVSSFVSKISEKDGKTILGGDHDEIDHTELSEFDLTAYVISPNLGAPGTTNL